MTQINAYLGFNGACAEAMTFYQECLGGELTLQKFEDTPMGSQCPEGMKNQIMHASLTKNGLILMATDMNAPGEEFIKGNNIALSLSCSSEPEINDFFKKLSNGGKIVDPLKIQFWGALFGVLKDKFGIIWMLNYDKSQN
jgi:PhnB protein